MNSQTCENHLNGNNSSVDVNLESNITRRQLLRQKVNNLCNYMRSNFPNKNLRITELEKYPEEQIVCWIIQELVPYDYDKEKRVLQLCADEGINPSKDVLQKLTRYVDFFCQIVK